MDWKFEDFAEAYKVFWPWSRWRLHAKHLKTTDVERYDIEAYFARWYTEVENDARNGSRWAIE